MPAQLFEAIKEHLNLEEKCKDNGKKCLYLILDLEVMEGIVKNVNLVSNSGKRQNRPLISCALNKNVRNVIFLSTKNNYKHSKIVINMDKCIKKGCDSFRFKDISYAFESRKHKLLIFRFTNKVFDKKDLLKFCGTCDVDLEFCNDK